MTESFDFDRRRFLAGALSAVAAGSVPTLAADRRSPYPKSNAIHGIKWLTGPLKYPECSGDTWSTTWADDGHVIVCGLHGVGLFARLQDPQDGLHLR